MWNKRYAGRDYVYGEDPNDFFKKQISGLRPGRLLLPAEGEGRNAVYAAALGWEVTAFDSSDQAKSKALKLAHKKGVRINYQVCSFEQFNSPEYYFDVLVLIFAHIDNSMREMAHQKLLRYLKKGGIVILEAFSREQLKYESGGPKSLDLLFDVGNLKKDFESLTSLKVWKETRNLSEGELHKGLASVVRLTGTK